MLFLFRSAPEVEKRIHSKLFRKFWRSRGTKEPAYINVHRCEVHIPRLLVCTLIFFNLGYPCLRPDRQVAQLPTTKISHFIAIIITLYDLHQARCRQRTEPRLHVERPDALFVGGDVGHPQQIHVRVQCSHQVKF